MRILTVLSMLCCAAAQAHEIGTTRVSVVFTPERMFEAEIVTDAESLVEKMSAAPVPLAQLDKAFRKRVTAAFDGVESEPEIEYAVAEKTATIRLRGAVPEGARQFTWSYGWTFTPYSLAIRPGPGADASTQWLEGKQVSEPFDLSAVRRSGRFSTAWRYVVLGFTHIVPHGLDHVLFVLGIYLLSRKWRDVLWQVSAFTAAHSITLGLSLYGVVSLPAAIVEPLIALSIAYVAIENMFLKDLKPRRVALVFAFGLLHGMGFAGVLRELGLPEGEFVTALLTFNLGVEAGQLAVIASAALAVGWWANRPWYRSWVAAPASAMIACVAVYWTVERLAS